MRPPVATNGRQPEYLRLRQHIDHRCPRPRRGARLAESPVQLCGRFDLGHKRSPLLDSVRLLATEIDPAPRWNSSLSDAGATFVSGGARARSSDRLPRPAAGCAHASRAWVTPAGSTSPAAAAGTPSGTRRRSPERSPTPVSRSIGSTMACSSRCAPLATAEHEHGQKRADELRDLQLAPGYSSAATSSDQLRPRRCYFAPREPVGRARGMTAGWKASGLHQMRGRR